MKNIARLILPIIICGIVTIFGVVNVASAATEVTESSEAVLDYTNLQAVQCKGCPADLFGEHGVFKNITNTVLYIVGILAVIMLIIGGIKYVTSGGDSKKVTDAKNTILYAIIGLIICFLAFAIVNFVIAALPNSGAE
jgi:glucose uptake protein GlcU